MGAVRYQSFVDPNDPDAFLREASLSILNVTRRAFRQPDPLGDVDLSAVVDSALKLERQIAEFKTTTEIPVALADVANATHNVDEILTPWAAHFTAEMKLREFRAGTERASDYPRAALVLVR